MGFDDAMRAAAKIADGAVHRAMRKYGDGFVTDEDDLTGVLLGNLDAAFDKQIGGIRWTSSILRHRRGLAAEEQKIGADMLIHVRLNTPLQRYSKAVLVQAKRHEPVDLMNQSEQQDLTQQCKKMLAVTPAAFVFDYARGSMRCGSASKIAGSSNRNLYGACTWTSYRFFLELFRSPIGDPRLNSALVGDLPVPVALNLVGQGDISAE